MIEVWEPWTPTLGDRVRVRTSPECACFEVRISRLHDGRTGVIVEDRNSVELSDPHPWVYTHRYEVRYDEPILDDEAEVSCLGGFWSIAEIEPLV